MRVIFDLAEAVEDALRSNGIELENEAKEAFLVALFRQGRITRHQLAVGLNMSELQSNEMLAKHDVSWGPTVEEIREEAQLLRKGVTR